MELDLLLGLLVLLGTLIGNLVSFGIQRLIIKGEKSNHISKVRFDKEFEIYQELSEKNLDVVNSCMNIDFYFGNLLGIYDKISEDKTIKDSIDNFNNKINIADTYNKKYAPFIDKGIYDSYYNLIEKAKDLEQMLFVYFVNNGADNLPYKKSANDPLEYFDKFKFVEIMEKKKENIAKLSNTILDELREYLKSLDVKE